MMTGQSLSQSTHDDARWQIDAQLARAEVGINGGGLCCPQRLPPDPKADEGE